MLEFLPDLSVLKSKNSLGLILSVKGKSLNMSKLGNINKSIQIIQLKIYFYTIRQSITTAFMWNNKCIYVFPTAMMQPQQYKVINIHQFNDSDI